jgi:recombination protein RecA
MAKTGIEKTLGEINKKFGAGSIVRASEAKALVVKRVSTGSFAVDVEMGGGYPVGRIITIAGQYSASKTTFAIHGVKQFLLAFPHKDAAWIAIEEFDLDWAKNILTDEELERLVIVRPQTAEAALDIADVLIRSGEVSVVVVDSLAAIVPTAEVEGSIEDWTMGLAARLNGKFFRKANSGLAQGDLTDDSDLPCTVIVLNQLRDTMDKYKPETMPGGRAQGFFSSVILWLRIGERFKVKDEESKKEMVYAQEVKFKTEKNKTFAPFRQGTYDLYVDKNTKGIPIGHFDRLKEVATYAIYWGVIKRKGPWYYIGTDMKIQGGEALVAALRDNDELRERIESETMAIATSGKSKKEVTTHETAEGNQMEVDEESGEILSETP